MTDKLLEEPLSDEDRTLFAMYEEEIEKGIDTYVEIGNYLCLIRDKQLFRETHSSFTAYVRDRWKMTYTRAYQLICHAEVIGELTSTIVNVQLSESHTRELAKAPVEQRAEILEEAAASVEGPVTARAIKKAVERRAATTTQREPSLAPPPRPSPPPSPLPEPIYDGNDDFDDCVQRIKDAAGECEDATEFRRRLRTLVGLVEMHREYLMANR